MNERFRNNQKLQVSVHPVMRRKLPLLYAGVVPPGRPICTTLRKIAGLVSDRDAEGYALRFMRTRTNIITVPIEAEIGIPDA